MSVANDTSVPVAAVDQRRQTLVIACGALAHEIIAVLRLNGLDQVAVTCLPPELHNRPEQIPDAVREKIHEAREQEFQSIFVAYGDCGTGGLLDRVLAEEQVERIGGAHCYEFFAGSKNFQTLADEEPGSFYLTDFLVHQFDRLVWRGLGLDRYPQLRDSYFGNYRRLVYLSQRRDPELETQAREAAARLGLDYYHQHTGYGDLQRTLIQVV
jgi:hypothetical protein